MICQSRIYNKLKKVIVSTWSFGFPVRDAAQSKDDSALILLNNLQEDHSTQAPFKITFKL